MLQISTFYASVPKAIITWGTNPEIWHETDSFVILGHFLSFYTRNNLENQNFEQLKKESGDAIIVHMYTINDNHMMYASWDMECNRQFFVVSGHFLPFHPTIDTKNFSNYGIYKEVNYHLVIISEWYLFLMKFCFENVVFLYCFFIVEKRT